jgi:hypothetical protein
MLAVHIRIDKRSIISACDDVAPFGLGVKSLTNAVALSSYLTKSFQS